MDGSVDRNKIKIRPPKRNERDSGSFRKFSFVNVTYNVTTLRIRCGRNHCRTWRFSSKDDENCIFQDLRGEDYGAPTPPGNNDTLYFVQQFVLRISENT